MVVALASAIVDHHFLVVYVRKDIIFFSIELDRILLLALFNI